MMADGPAEEDTFKILLATDIHLGYEEKDPIRGKDSFIAFEEILRLAVDNSVDFILLGGDLFHDSKPSPLAFTKCMNLLRKYCLGDTPVSVEFLSDPSESFSHCEVPVVNYEDPNLNVAIPVFTIHGNHDDPSGPKMHCALDLLSTTGYINHFGKWTDLTKIEVKPLLLKKGRSLLALFGIGHIKDARFSRLLNDDKVKFYRPSEDKEKWFNIFVLHQNRADRGLKNYVREDMLPDFIDLAVWGHEHDCRITPERKPSNDVYITQPGSSVATSLSEGEAIPKHVGLLRIFEKKFNLTAIPLQTVRPFIFETLTLSETDLNPEDERAAQAVEKLAEARIEEMLLKAQERITGKPEQPTLPLIRLRIEYSTERQLFNKVRFGQKFENRVANPADVVLMRKEKADAKVKRSDILDTETLHSALERLNQRRDEISICDVMEQYFADQQEKDETRCMKVLSTTGMLEALKRYTEGNDKDAISCITKHQAGRTTAFIMEQDDEDFEENIEHYVERFRIQRAERAEEESRELRAQLDLSQARSQRPTRGRGRGARGAAAASRVVDDDDVFARIDLDSDDDANGHDTSGAAPVPKTGRGSRGGRGARAARQPRGSRARGATTATSANSTAASESFAAMFNATRNRK